MSRYNGFVMLRRGLFEHLATGQVSPTECLVFCMLLSGASSSTGVVNSCAESLSWESGRGIPTRSCQDALASLEKKGSIKRFRLKGKHGNYPILVDNYRVTTGQHAGKRVNAGLSQEVTRIVFEPECLRTEQNGESPLSGSSSGSSQEMSRTEPGTDYSSDSSTLTITNNLKRVSGAQGPGAPQEVTKINAGTPEVLKLIDACYVLAERASSRR